MPYDLQQFLTLLHPGPDEHHYIATFKPETDTALIPNEATQLVQDFLVRHDHKDIYIGVAARSPEGRDLENCTALHALFCEIDYKDIPEEQAENQIASFPYPPSIVISSGGGLHLYWLLHEKISLQRGGADLAKEYLRALAQRLQADLRSAEPARVLRVPGTWNTKYTPEREVQVISWNPNIRYDLFDIMGECPMIQKGDNDRPKPSPPLPHDILGGARNDTLFREGCRLRRLGFEYEEILAALHAINTKRCRPPVDSREVQTISRSASKYEKAEDPYPSTESGDAEFFADCNQDMVRYDHRRGRWLLYAGHHWLPQVDGEVNRMALDVTRARKRAAHGDKDKETWSTKGESRARLNNMLTLVQSVKPIADPGTEWDLDPYLLGVQNGIVDLRTGTLRPGLPEDRVTQRVLAEFDPNAKCPQWGAAILDIMGGDRELTEYLQRFVGYSITGDCSEEVLILAWGGGSNGKGTVMNTLGWLLGDYADNLPFSSLELQNNAGIPNDLAKIVGKRFITSSESGEAKRLNEARVKALTGRDPITARFLRQEFFTFEPQAKFWLATNHKPVVKDTSVGFWRRIHLLPFIQNFENRRDNELKFRLRAQEGPGILAWAVRGALEWQRSGLRPPPAVQSATQSYREEMDPLSEFIEEKCDIGERYQVRSNSLFQIYSKWAEANGHENMSGRSFSIRLEERGFRKSRDRAGSIFHGLQLAGGTDYEGL